MNMLNINVKQLTNYKGIHNSKYYDYFNEDVIKEEKAFNKELNNVIEPNISEIQNEKTNK